MADDDLTKISEAVLKEAGEEASVETAELDRASRVEEMDETERALAGEEPESPEAGKPARKAATGGEAEEAAEAWTPPSQDEFEKIRGRAELVDQFDARFQRDPAGELAAWFQMLDPAAQARYLAAIGAGAQVAEPDPFEGMDPEEMTPVERAVAERKDFLIHGERRLQEAHQAAQALTLQATQTNFEMASLFAQLRVIADMLDFELPMPDVNKVGAAINQGKNPWQAVDELYKPVLQEAAKAAKAKGRPVPGTPRSVGGGEPKIDAKGKSFSQIAAALVRNGLAAPVK
jgi:NADH dehydrogenase/NADH:ubiquinone oxidoreductase subunit G